MVAQLTAVRIFWWSISRKLASVMVHGSLRLATRPQRFPRGRLVFSASLVAACGFAMVDSVRGRGAATPERCRQGSVQGLASNQEMICSHSPAKGSLWVAAMPAPVFFALALGIRSGEACCRNGDTPLFRKHSHRTIVHGKNTYGGRRDG